MDLRALVQANRDLQRDSPTLRLFAADTIAAVLALMERHLDRGVKVAETELVASLERDMPTVGLTSQTPAQLISSWGERGWLHRISDDVVPGARRICWLSAEAQTVLDLVRRIRNDDTVATGGSIIGIADRLKRVAGQLDSDPERLRNDLDERIAELQRQRDDLDAGLRPDPNLLDLEDEAKAIGRQMEQVIADIGRYGTMQNRITTGLLSELGDSDLDFRDRQRKLFTDYDALYESREQASYAAFTRCPRPRCAIAAAPRHRARGRRIAQPRRRFPRSLAWIPHFGKPPDERGRPRTPTLRATCPPILRRGNGRAEPRIRPPTQRSNPGRTSPAAGVADRFPARLRTPDRHIRCSHLPGALGFKIVDPTPPPLAQESAEPLDIDGFSALAAQVDVEALAGLVNAVVESGPVSLPEAFSLVDDAYLGELLVLWTWAQAQPQGEANHSSTVTVQFRSIGGSDRQMQVPLLMFTEPVLEGELL